MSAFVCLGRLSLLTSAPPRLTSSTQLPCPTQGSRAGGGLAGGQARVGHLPAQTEFELDKSDPIPVFVPVTGQIPGLRD